MPNKIDLNNLEILCVLVETKSVTEAAKRLNKGISSISYAMNKLRNNFSDPLLIRSKQGMIPTLLAIDLYKQFSPALSLIKSVASEKIDKELNDKKIYRIRTNSVMEGLLSSFLIQKETIITDGITYEFNNFSSEPAAREEALRRKQVDIDIGDSLEVDRSIAQYQYVMKGMNFVCRDGHPYANKILTFEMLSKQKFLTWVNGKLEVGTIKYMVYFDKTDELFRPIRFSSFDTMLTIISRTDCLSLVPTAMNEYVKKMYSLKVLKTDIIIDYDYTGYVHILKSSRKDLVVLDIIKFFKQFSP